MEATIQTYYLDKPLQVGRVFDVFEPKEITKDVAMFFVHGGGWRAGSRADYHKLMEAFVEKGYIVAATDYRLNAKTAFEQLDDIRQAYDKFITILKEKNRPLKVAFHGGSAGAHLSSLILCTEYDGNLPLENEWVKPVMGILQSCPADFVYHEWRFPSIWSSMQSIAGVPYEEDPKPYEKLSLINYINASNPPLFFVGAELEHMFPNEYTLEIVKKHREMGIPSQWKVYEKAEHGFFFDFTRKMQRDAFEDICKFLEEKFETL